MSERSCPNCERVCLGCGDSDCGNTPCSSCEVNTTHNDELIKTIRTALAAEFIAPDFFTSVQILRQWVVDLCDRLEQADRCVEGLKAVATAWEAQRDEARHSLAESKYQTVSSALAVMSRMRDAEEDRAEAAEYKLKTTDQSWDAMHRQQRERAEAAEAKLKEWDGYAGEMEAKLAAAEARVRVLEDERDERVIDNFVAQHRTEVVQTARRDAATSERAAIIDHGEKCLAAGWSIDEFLSDIESGVHVQATEPRFDCSLHGEGDGEVCPTCTESGEHVPKEGG